MLRSDLCDYAEAYILVNGTTTVTANAEMQKQLILEIKKIDH